MTRNELLFAWAEATTPEQYSSLREQTIDIMSRKRGRPSLGRTEEESIAIRKSQFSESQRKKRLRENELKNQEVTEEPVTEEPVTEEPVTQEPVTQEPVTQEPVTQEADIAVTVN